MGVRDFFDKTVIVSRLKDIGGGKKNITTTATVNCALQELDRQARAEIDMVQDRGWIGYFDIDDVDNVKEGDDIVDGNGVTYTVLETTRKDYGINQHLEVILIDHEDDE